MVHFQRFLDICYLFQFAFYWWLLFVSAVFFGLLSCFLETGLLFVLDCLVVVCCFLVVLNPFVSCVSHWRQIRVKQVLIVDCLFHPLKTCPGCLPRFCFDAAWRDYGKEGPIEQPLGVWEATVPWLVWWCCVVCSLIVPIVLTRCDPSGCSVTCVGSCVWRLCGDRDWGEQRMLLLPLLL